MLYRKMFLAVGLSATMLLAACGGDDPNPTPTPVAAVEGAVVPADATAVPVEEVDASTEPIDSELPQAGAIRATTLIGLDVQDSTGEHIGTVDDAFVLVADGEIQYAIVTASGLEGAFTDWVLPLPVSAININAERDSLVISRSAAELANAPGYAPDAQPDMNVDNWDADIRAFWADLTTSDEPVATATPMMEEEIDDEEMDDTEVTGTDTITDTDIMTDTEVMTGSVTGTITGDVSGTITGTVTETDTITDTESMTDTADMETEATPVAEELVGEMDEDTDVIDEEAGEVDDINATATPIAEEEMMDDDADDTDATATPVAEEEAAAVSTPLPVEEADSATDDGEIMILEPYALSLERLLEFEVRDATGESLGEVEDMVIDWSEGKIEYVVLSFGGFLGLGERWFAFPWSELVFDPVENAFVTTATEEMLEDAPGFDNNNWPDFNDPTWEDQYFEYWNTN